MIKDIKLLTKLENKELKEEKLSYLDALKLFEAMWQQGVSLGVLPLKDALEDIESDINLTKVLNSCLKDS